MRIQLSCFVPLLLLAGCVSSGKFKALQQEKSKSEEAWAIHRAQLDSDLQKVSAHNETLNAQLVHQNTLLSELLNDKMELEKQVVSLRDRIMNLSSESKSLEANLNEELERKNENLKLKEAKLNRMVNWLLQQEANLNKISAALGEAMTGYTEEEIEWYFQDNRLDIILYHDFMFSGTGTLSTRGSNALDKLSNIITQFASLGIMVEGHTDNSFLSNSQALSTSTQRAVTIGTYLVEGNVNGNQLTICGRGSYFPRVSNQTPAGRALNNRVEISLHPPYPQLLALLEE